MRSLLCSLLVAVLPAEGSVETDVSLGSKAAEALHRGLKGLLGRKFKEYESSREVAKRRRLQNETFVPRSCGETIAVLTKEEFQPLFLGLISGSVNETDILFRTGVSVIKNALENDILASKICSSCADIIERYGEEILTRGSEEHGFASYCGPGKFGASETVTGLLLQPYDASTRTVTQGSLSTALWSKIATTAQWEIPSEEFPTNITSVLPNATNSSREEVENAIASVANVLAPIFATATGAVSIVADYIGYGESDHPKSSMVKQYYQASSIPLYLAAKQDITAASSCSGLSGSVSIHGYSESGYSAVAVAVALNDMEDVTVRRVSTGGAPFRMSSIHYVQVIRNLNDGSFLSDLHFYMAQLGNAYSSTNPDLANTGEMDALSEAWKDQVRVWIAEGQSNEEVNAQLGNSTLNIFNPIIVQYGMNATAEGISDLCLPEYASRENYPGPFCEALMGNDLVHLLENASFPVTLCHSVDDTVADIRNLPDTALNPNLESFGFITPEGDHFECGSICGVANMMEFTVYGLNTIPLNRVTDDRCLPTPSPTLERTPPSAPPKQQATTSAAASLDLGGKGWLAGGTMMLLAALSLL